MLKGRAYKIIETMGFLILITMTICSIMFIVSLAQKSNETFLNSSLPANGKVYEVKSYLVYSNKCRIPDIDAFNNDVAPYIEKKEFISCAKQEDLLYITKNEYYTQAFMHVNKTMLKAYNSREVVCNLSTIMRYKLSDDQIIAVDPVVFTTNTTLPANVPVRVSCKDKHTTAEVFANTYYPVLRNYEVDINIYNRNSLKSPFSVLLIAIDSVSRGEMARSMPITREYLERNNWVEMLGYNKVAENTFPNVMALLAGRNETFVADGCDSLVNGGLDKCNFIWKNYSKVGFITTFVEGNRRMSTFNYEKKGFQRDPTDYYSRQYFLAGAKLSETSNDEVQYCVGPISETERILNVMKESVVVFKNDPTFSVYWMNHAHSTLNAAKRYDLKIKEALEFIESAGTLNNSVVILFSDHGFRMQFPYVLNTFPGQFEKRSPFLYMHLPERFKREYPVKSKNLDSNANKLVTPYDVYATLQEILALGSVNYTAKASMACEKSLSLFDEIPNERSCEDACVPYEFCRCNNFEPIDTKNATVEAAARFIVKTIVAVFDRSTLARKCARYKLDHVIAARVFFKTRIETQLLIVLKTIPEAVFENVVAMDLTEKGDERFKTVGELSRLDENESRNSCVGSVYLKKLCYCE